MPRLRCPICSRAFDGLDAARFTCPACGYSNHTADPYPMATASPFALAPAGPAPEARFYWPHAFPAPPPSLPVPGASVLAFILGLLSLPVAWLPFVGAPLGWIGGAGAVISGALGLRIRARMPLRYGGRALALAGILLGLLGLAAATLAAFVVGIGRPR